jgi:hypothetical protein
LNINESTWAMLQNVATGKDILHKILQTQAMKAKIDKWKLVAKAHTCNPS